MSCHRCSALNIFQVVAHFCWFHDSCEGVCENSTPPYNRLSVASSFSLCYSRVFVSTRIVSPKVLLSIFLARAHPMTQLLPSDSTPSKTPVSVLFCANLSRREYFSHRMFLRRICLAKQSWCRRSAGQKIHRSRSRERTTGSPLLSRISARPEAPTSEV